MDESKLPSISPQGLDGAIGTAAASVLINARHSGAHGSWWRQRRMPAARQDSGKAGGASGRERSAVQGSMAARTVIRAVGIVVAMTFREATWSM